MSETAAPAAIGEVRSAAQVLHDDVMCQSFIQGSSTLAYACVLIRRGQYELAGHVLRHLDGRKAGRYRDIVFYLCCQIDTETGLYAPVKQRLVARLREQPADSVALSLLQACLQAELQANPMPISMEASYASAVAASDLARASGMVAQVDAEPLPVEPVPAYPLATETPDPPPPKAESMRPVPEPPMVEVRPSRQARDISASADVDMVPFQPVIQDPGTRAFTVWDSYSGDIRKSVRDADLEGVVTDLPALLPAALARAVAGLDAGRTIKTCFAFKQVTVTTLHQGDLNCGLITGPLNQSLIAVVRTETLFAKRAGQLGKNKAGEPDGAN